LSYCGRPTHRANSQPFGDWEAEENGTDEGKGRKGYEKTEFDQDATISVEEEAIFVESYKSRARDLDLEHTLDARSAGNHRVQVWSQSSHLSRSRSDLRKKFTDGQTDRRRTPRDCISSWNELKIGCHTRADCNFAAPKSREMPDAPLITLFCRPFLIAARGVPRPYATLTNCSILVIFVSFI